MATIESSSSSSSSSANTGFNKLLPKPISSKRLRRKQGYNSEAPGHDEFPDDFGRSQPSYKTLESDGKRSRSLAGDEDGDMSLRSYESDDES